MTFVSSSVFSITSFNALIVMATYSSAPAVAFLNVVSLSSSGCCVILDITQN